MEKVTIARELYAQEKGSWLLGRSIVVKSDADDENEDSYSMDDCGNVKLLENSEARIKAFKNAEKVFAVSKNNSIDFLMVFENVRHEDGYDWCFNIEGRISIQNTAEFLKNWKDFCGVKGLDSNTFLDRVYTLFSPAVRDMVREQENFKIKEIEECDVLSAVAWERVFKTLPVMSGLGINVTHKSFFSPDVEVAKKMAEEAELRRAAEDEKKLEYEAEINAQNRADEIEEIKRRREIAELEHQKKVAELKDRITFCENQGLQVQYKNLIDAQSAIEDAINRQNGNVENLQGVLKEVLSKIESLSEKVKRIPHNVELIVDPVVVPRYQGMSKNFLEMMTQIKSRGKNSVTLSYQVRDPYLNYRTRSIISDVYTTRTLGCIGSNGKERKDVLHLRDGVTIRLASERSGYLTLINLGTSPGVVNKIFPDRRLGAKSRRIEANKTYLMPGDLIPCPKGMEWWPVTGAVTSDYGLKERVLAIVTDDDVNIDVSKIGSVSTDDGFELAEERITSVLDMLKLQDGSWGWGFLEAEVLR